MLSRMLDLRIATEGPTELAPHYLLARLVTLWRHRGLHLAIGPCRTLDATCGIVHYDRTEVPAAAVPEAPDTAVVWNRHVRNIGKRLVSTQQVTPGDGYQGPVIVKTDANSRAGPELAEQSPWSWPRMRRRLVPLLGWRRAHELPRGTYPILARPADVPAWVWQRRDLVVERFLPERAGTDYVLHYWLFAGTADCVLRLQGPTPVLKFRTSTSHAFLDAVPPSLRGARARLRMDYGKIDYVMVDGQAVVLDANTTPIVPTALTSEPRILALASGLPVPVADPGRGAGAANDD
jgi:hypothetical protein